MHMHTRVPCRADSRPWIMVCADAEQHPVLLELLEVPQLMSACVRNGSYDEALDLRAFASKIALLHPNVEASTSLQTADARSPVLLHVLL